MMEHRLIYADELYDMLANKLTWLMKYGDDVYLEVGKDIREAINDQPTAYDIEDIVKQLEKEKERQRENAIDRNYRFGVVNGLNVSIGVVKDGAK